MGGPYDAIIFDLLTALIDSWTVWKDVAGSDEDGPSLFQTDLWCRCLPVL